MTLNRNGISRDLIADAIATPIEWRRFESLAYAILVADDLPKLRSIGGISDQGVDAQEEIFFDGERKIKTIVQVTSAAAQAAKAKSTIKKLKANGIAVSTLVLLTQHPVSSEVKRKIIDDSESEGVAVDIRDDQYLIAQLSKPNSTIYSRFFDSAKQQLDELLSKSDPLEATGDKLQHALLASLGAFVLSPRARLARSTLFDKTVLAVLAASGGTSTREQISESLNKLNPGENAEMTCPPPAVPV